MKEETMVNTAETENAGHNNVNKKPFINSDGWVEYEGHRVLGFFRFDDPVYVARHYWALYVDGPNYYFDYSDECGITSEDGIIKFDGSLLPSVNYIIKCSSSPLQVARYLRDNGGICIDDYDEEQELRENIFAGIREFLSHYLTA